MSLNPKNIYIIQRTDDGTAWGEVYISGSNLIIQTDSNGHVIGSTVLPPDISVFSASYALTASYVSGSSGTSITASYALMAGTASYVFECVTSSYSLLAKTASFANTTQTSSYSVSASYAPFPSTASWADNSISASWAPTAATSATGSVTSVSVATANGISGTVANTTTNPNITIVLGNIAPTSVSSSFTGNLLGTSSFAQNAQTYSASFSTSQTANSSSIASTVTALSKSLAAPTASLFGTASWADNSISASWSPTATTTATGSVTSVSVASSNGVSGIVANLTTNALITIILGNIAPTSVSSSFTGSLLGTASFANNAQTYSSSLSDTDTTNSSSFSSTITSLSHSLTLATASYAQTASNAITASYAMNGGGGGGGGGTTTGSFTGSFTGSVLGTASFANNAQTYSSSLTTTITANSSSASTEITSLSSSVSTTINALSSSYTKTSASLQLASASLQLVSGSVGALSQSAYEALLDVSASFTTKDNNTSASFTVTNIATTSSIASISSSLVQASSSLQLLSASIAPLSSSLSTTDTQNSASFTTTIVALTAATANSSSVVALSSSLQQLSSSIAPLSSSISTTETQNSSSLSAQITSVSGAFSSTETTNSASLLSFSASFVSISASFSEELTQFTGSVFGTASWANSSLSASWAPASGTGSGGTVTVVSVTTYNGVSGTVANPSSTPEITIVLNNITASSLLSTGPITASSVTASFTGSLYGTASAAISASWAPGGVPNPGTVSSSAQLDNGGGTAFTSVDNVTFGQVTASMLTVSISSSLGVASAVNINTTSARKYKENIKDLDNGVEILNQLRPVIFDWKDKHKLKDLGFIADEVKDVLPTLVSHNKDGEVEGLDYDKLTAVLASALQTALFRIDKLEERLNSSDRK